MAKLPTVTSPLPRDLQQFVQRVREALDSGGPDAVVTARQLIAAGVVDSSAGGGVAPIGGTVDPPRAPSGLTASGALASIIVSWNGPQYKGHAYTEIWAHTSDLLGDAVLVGMTAGNNFAHNLGNAAVRYYWVRNVNQNGVVSAFNATNGTQGTTGQDPAYLLTVLTDEITATQLASSLGTRIDLIDGAANVAGSVNARISTEATARTNADTSLASDITTLQTTTGGHTTSIQTNATSINGLEGQYTVKIDNNGHVSGFGLASTTVDGARVSDFMVAADRFSVVNPTAAGGAITACFDAYPTYRRYIKIPDAMWNSYVHTSGDRLTIKGMGSRNNTYEIISKGNYLTPSIGKALVVSERSDEIPYTYLPDLPSANGQSYSERMAATYPEATGTINLAKEVPFVISTGSTQINGVTVPAGTYIDSAMIADATITNAQIGSLTADKITASLLNTVDFYGNTIAGSSIYLGGTVTYSQTNNVNTGIQSIASPKVAMTSTGAVFAVDAFTIDNPGGTDVTPFSITNDVVEIDTALISDGTITMAKIEDTIKSTNYSNASNTGWKLDQDGTLDLNSASITAGTLQSTDGNFVINLTNGTITISS